MNKKFAAVLCAGGIGDGLLMMISACQLRKIDYDVHVYHNHTEALAPLFPTYSIKTYPPLHKLIEMLKGYELILLENDNSEMAWTLFRERDKGNLPQLRVFFPTPCHVFQPSDIFFNRYFPIATNIATATQFLLGLDKPYRDNDLKIPENKQYRHFKNRIVIHPTSKDPKRNWRPKQFLALAHRLKKEHYQPVFLLTAEERLKWEFIEKEKFLIPSLDTLEDVAAYIYESGYLVGNDSGLGHLASNLGIPTLTISGNIKRARLWRPHWTYGEIVTPYLRLPNLKGKINLRIRERFWHYFLSEKKVWKSFKRLLAHET